MSNVQCKECGEMVPWQEMAGTHALLCREKMLAKHKAAYDALEWLMTFETARYLSIDEWLFRMRMVNQEADDGKQTHR